MQSVLSTIYVYWASIFILPKKVIKDIEQLIRNFLWSGNDLDPYKAKVAWRDICYPKKQGGLGIKPLYVWNQSLVAKLVWRLLVGNKESLWVQWVHTYRVRGTCFWLLKTPYACPWYWRKLLLVRGTVKPFFGWRIGDGCSTFFWYDQWHPLGVLIDHFSRQLPRQLGIPILAKVEDFIEDGAWTRMEPFRSLSPEFGEDRLPTLFLPSRPDELYWLPTSNGLFSVRSAFQAIQTRRDPVPWYRLVWSSASIPTYSFIFWLAIRERLFTLDRINRFLSFPNRCFLCRSDAERHSHLFFQCSYSREVLSVVQRSKKFSWPWRRWEIGVLWAAARWSGNSPWQVANRLLLQTMIYFIWRERNNRCFRDQERSASQLAHLIQSAVWARLISIHFRPSLQTHALRHVWRLPRDQTSPPR